MSDIGMSDIAIETSRNRVPKCVATLLARLEQAGRNLAEERPEGPYMIEALLQDVGLCPAIGSGPNAPEYVDLAKKLSSAHDAVKVVLSCPVSSRDFAVDRLRVAIVAANEAVQRRVDGAKASGDRTQLSGSRCASCAFAQA